jgi:predicted permease
VRQLLTESGVLAVLGGGAGLFLAWSGIGLFRRLDPGTLPRVSEVTIDGSVVTFSIVVTLATVLLFGVLPALRAGGRDLRDRMGGRGDSAVRRSRWQGSLVAAEIALAVVLVVGAGLLVRTFDRLTAIDPGFDGSNVISAAVSLPTTTYTTPEEMLAFHREAILTIEALPGVEQAAGARLLPLASQIGDWGLMLEAYDPPDGHPMNGDWQFAAPGYFEVMGIPVVRGRGIEAGDDENGALVVVVNEAFVRHFWPGGEDPIGRRMAMNTGADEPAWATIVGVVGDVTHNGLTAEIKRKFYIPLGQWNAASNNQPTSMRYVAQASGGAASARALTGPIREAIRSLDPTLAVAEVQTVGEIKSSAVSLPRFTAVLMGVFSLIAVVLAVIGIYGVVSYGVSQRIREIGVRMALGAPRESVVRLMLAKGLAMILVGLAVGTGAAFLLSGFLGALLYEVPPTDPATYVGVVLGFGAVALAATWWPSRRAARIDPARTLRSD